MTKPYALPNGYLLEDRYLLLAVSRHGNGGIIYTAQDKKLRIPAEVLEYLPEDCVVERAEGETDVRGDERFREKCGQVLASGIARMRDSGSHIYDVFPANGTVYLVHTLPQAAEAESDEPVSAEPMSTEPVQTESTSDAEATRVLDGLFPETDEIDLTEEVEAVENARAVHADETIYTDAVPEDTLPLEDIEEEEPVLRGPSVKVLLVILIVGILLLLGCCVVFLTSLFRITELPSGTGSLLHVPYAALEEDGDWLVTGRAVVDSYAPGMVIAEEAVDGTIEVSINGETPAFRMPELTGMTVEGASALLGRTHFTNAAGQVQGQVVIQRQQVTDKPHGMVLSQSPAAGTLAKSALVTLTVAENDSTFAYTSGDETMPDLVGQTYASVLSGHALLISDRVYSERPAGEILSQYPAAGASYPVDGPCYVVVSQGAAKTHVPDVQFLTLAEAETALYGCGLSFSVRYALCSHVQEGLVAEVSPAAGTALDYGETVTLTISGSSAESWQSGPPIQQDQTQVQLTVGDTYTMALEDDTAVVYHTTDPAVVSVTADGTLTALSAGYAVVTASAAGQTVVMHMEVAYDKRLPYVVDGLVGEKISLPALGNADAEGTVWQGDTTFATITEDGILTGKQAGDTLLIGEKGGKVSLYLVHLTEAETEKQYVTIAKSTAADRAKMEKALAAAGLACTIQEETNEKAAGTVLRIQYSGYSDDKDYHFAEGSGVTLIVSAGLPTVRSIAIETMPKKTTYGVGEVFDPTGLSIRVTYSDKTEEVLTMGFVTTYDFTSKGRKTVAIAYGGRKTALSVEIIETGPVAAEILALPDKVDYNIGDTLDTAGLQVKVRYGDGTAKTFLSGFETKYSFAKAGTSRVTVTVEGVSASFDVTVSERKVRSITVGTLPTRTQYSTGDTIDTAGMTLLVQYTDGSTETLQAGWTVRCDLTTAGTKTATVSYGGKSTTYSVTVSEAPVTAIQVVTQPKKLTYRLGESIDLAGLELSVSRGNHSTSVTWPDAGISFEGTLDTTGECVITLSYGGCTDTIRVSVNAPAVVSLTILTLPQKLTYAPGDEPDPTGLVLLATYEDGSTAQVTEGFAVAAKLDAVGEAAVTVTYQGAQATYTVQVQESTKALTLSAESLQVQVGEAVLLGIGYTGPAGTQLAYTIENPEVVRADNHIGGILLTGLRPGYCTLTMTDGVEEAVCTITVTAGTEDTLPVEVTMAIPHQTSATFMPTLTFTGNGVAETDVTFTATVAYDPAKLAAGDFGAIVEGITADTNGTDTITFTGTVTVPKDGTIEAGYILFYGTDMTAFQLSVE